MAYQQCQHKNNAKKNVFRDKQEKLDMQLKDIQNRLDEVNQKMTHVDNKMDKALEDLAILKAQADTILRQTFELAEYTIPRLFIVLPDDTPRYNPTHWLHLNYRLYFLCECEHDNERHFAFHEGYEIKQPREFFRKYGPYLCKMLTVVKCAISVGSLIVPQLSHVASGIPNFAIPKDQLFWNNLNTRIERLSKILTEFGKDHNISTTRNVQYVEGAELRAIESFLNKTDEHRTFGNLFRSVTKDGHVRWVCIQHHESHYSDSVIKNLHANFQNLGGKIKGDVAIIEGEALNKFSGMLNVLREGLQVFSVILKDLNLKEGEFNALLNYISQQSVIRNLEIENITVSKFMRNIKKRHIILKLEDAVRKNNKLTIQYSFTKSLSKFVSKLIDAITKTNSRLIFRVRSQEDTTSLELAGTKDTGFSLSINNNGENDNTSYMTAIKNIFSMMPNITEVLLKNGAVLRSIWTDFYQFLTTNQTLQELTVDCPLTLEQTRHLSVSLHNNRTLKTLHMFNVWKREEELTGYEDIFQMLHINTVLIDFSLTCHIDRLELGFVARYLLRNKSLRTLRLPKCQIYQNTDIELCESFLRNTSIHTLSLELISTNCQVHLERLARALDKNETLEILELKGSDCFAIFHRTKRIPDNENNIMSSSPAQINKPASRSKLKKFLGLFSCHKGKHPRHSHEEVNRPSAVPIQKNN